MQNHWSTAGLVFNSALIVIDRCFVKIPNRFYLSGLAAGIACILIGFIKSR